MELKLSLLFFAVAFICVTVFAQPDFPSDPDEDGLNVEVSTIFLLYSILSTSFRIRLTFVCGNVMSL